MGIGRPYLEQVKCNRQAGTLDSIDLRSRVTTTTAQNVALTARFWAIVSEIGVRTPSNGNRT